MLIDDERGGVGKSDRRDERQAFEPNRERKRREGSAKNCRARSQRCHREAQHRRQRQHDLDIVVVDLAGAEEIAEGDVVRCEGDRDERRPDAKASPERHEGEHAIEREEKSRPRCQHDALGKRGAEGGRQRKERGRKRRVDEPRPVHARAVGREVAILMRVEPALALREVAHLLKAHAVVGAERRKVREALEAEPLAMQVDAHEKQRERPEKRLSVENAGRGARRRSIGAIWLFRRRHRFFRARFT